MGRTTSDMIAICIAGLAVAIFIAAIIWGDILFNKYACESKWAGTYQTEFKVIGGCRVNVSGKWIPELSVREFAQ